MYNPGDEDMELERLSRESADGYQAPGVPDWEALEARLDIAMPQDKRRKRFVFLWWFLPALLTAGIAGWYLKGIATQDTPTATATQQVTPSTTVEPSKAPVVELKKNNTPADQQNEPGGVAAMPDKIIADQIAVLTPIRKSAGGRSLPAIKKAEPDQRSSLSTEQSSNASPAAENGTSVLTSPSRQQQSTISIDRIPVVLRDPSDQSLKNENAEMMPEPFTGKIIDPIVTPSKKYFSLAVIGGVDKSTVKFHYDYEPGYNVGFLAGYHFNKSISLHTGAIFTQKNYKMFGSDFTAQKGTWPSYYKLETVEGYCRMWEVPLEFRYTINNKKGSSGVFFGAGISSYFMTSENYNYDYYSMGTLATKNIGYNSSARNLFSIVSLTAGFEQRLSPALYLQVAPYAKLPMGGVGSGSFQLSSFGVNFAAELRRPIRKW